MSSRTRYRIIRNGYSLVELMVAMVGASALMVGLSSTLIIALKATDTSNTSEAAIMDGNAAMTSFSSDIEFATGFSEQTAVAATFTVPDRDNDSNPETIRYAWSGTPGDPLTRQYNGGTAVNAVEDVHDFGIEYFQPATSVQYVTVWIRVTNNTQSSIETSIALLNRP